MKDGLHEKKLSSLSKNWIREGYRILNNCNNNENKTIEEQGVEYLYFQVMDKNYVHQIPAQWQAH